MPTPTHFLDDRDLTAKQRLALLEAAFAMKHGGGAVPQPLAGKHVAVIMQKPSLRTRVSFTIAIHNLGGQVVEVSSQNTKLGKGEDLQEWAGVLGRMTSALVARVYAQSDLEGLAAHAGVPVINALSDALHPCQSLADLFTIWEHEKLAGTPGSETAESFFSTDHRIAYAGDGNNVAHSLMLGAASLGQTIAIATPSGREPDAGLVAAARSLHPSGNKGVLVGHDLLGAVDGAHAVYTDTWVSMGQEGLETAAAVQETFGPFQITSGVMKKARAGAVFMHCLPAEPGHEMTAAVLRGESSVVLDQAENRLWTSQALLAHHTFGNLPT